MTKQALIKYQLPDSPGVYFFYAGQNLLYIGKATSLRDRVRSYFVGSTETILSKRGPKITQMLKLANKIKWQETDSVLEALLLETDLIKKYQPPYNTREKDDKSYWYIIITNEDFPRILPIRGRELINQKSPKNPYFAIRQLADNFENSTKVGIKIKDQFGPFPYGAEMKEALKIIRQIFPFRDTCIPYSAATLRGCFNRQIGLCPGVCTGEISKTEYRKIVQNIKLFFTGKKKKVIDNLEREMKSLAKKQDFEKAGQIRNQIFALNHIKDVSLLKSKETRGEFLGSLEDSPRVRIRIEAYDIAHLSGTNTTGAMVVWQNGEKQTSDYKKFKLKGAMANQPNDPANLREILERRFNHPEWGQPDIIVVDGNQVQVEVAKEVLRSRIWLREKRLLKTDSDDVRNATSSVPEVVFRTPQIVAVTKDVKHRAAKLMGDPTLIRDYHRAIIEANAEAHRFALAYHRKLRQRLV